MIAFSGGLSPAAIIPSEAEGSQLLALSCDPMLAGEQAPRIGNARVGTGIPARPCRARLGDDLGGAKAPLDYKENGRTRL